jgi:flagellar basal body-associated protein FliL
MTGGWSEGGASKLLVIVASTLLLAAAVAGGALLARPKSQTSKWHQGVVPLGSFVVNLDPADGFRYLKVTAALRVRSTLGGEAFKEAAAEEKYRWSDVLVRHLSGQRYSELRAPGGRRRLEAELVRRLNEEAQAEGEDKRIVVEGIYFSEFVAQ